MAYIKTILTLVLQHHVIAKELGTTLEFDSRVEINDELSANTGHLKFGDIPILNRKVIKGHRVSIREHPYVASVRRKFSHYISATILSKNLVVTVAHPLYGPVISSASVPFKPEQSHVCTLLLGGRISGTAVVPTWTSLLLRRPTISVPITELGIVVGENYSDRGSALLTVVLIIMHNDFDPFTLRNDIALLQTYEEVTFRGAVKPIKLLSPASSLHGHKGFVTGWGRCDTMGNEVCLSRGSKYYPDEKLDPMLRTVTFSVVHPNEKCLEYAQNGAALSAGMLCVGESRGDSPASPCLAAPGTPLVIDSALAGLQSWGYGCGYLTDLPLVYTDIQHYTPWLLQNIAILRPLTQQDLKVLFDVTKSAILIEWLTQTRAIQPEPESDSEKKLERLDIDIHLVQINGSVLDIRDTIEDGTYHKAKQELYELYKKVLDEEKKMKSIAKSNKIEAKPFLSEDAMLVGYNTTNFTSTV